MRHIQTPSINVYACPNNALVEGFLTTMIDVFSCIAQDIHIIIYLDKSTANFDLPLCADTCTCTIVRSYDELVNSRCSGAFLFILESKSFLKTFPSHQQPLLNRLRSQYELTIFMQWDLDDSFDRNESLSFLCLSPNDEWIDSIADKIWLLERAPYNKGAYLLSLIHSREPFLFIDETYIENFACPIENFWKPHE